MLIEDKKSEAPNLPGLGRNLNEILGRIEEKTGQKIDAYHIAPFKPNSTCAKQGDPFYTLFVSTTDGGDEFIVKCSSKESARRGQRMQGLVARHLQSISPLVLDGPLMTADSGRYVITAARALESSLADAAFQYAAPNWPEQWNGRETRGFGFDKILAEMTRHLYMKGPSIIPELLEQERGESVTFLGYQKLMKRLDRFENSEQFVKHYRKVRNDVFKDAPLTVIHGDLHPGNIFTEVPLWKNTGAPVFHLPLLYGPDNRPIHETKLIDWEDMQLGLAYQDWFYLSVIGDVEKSSSCKELTGQVMHDQLRAWIAVDWRQRNDLAQMIAEHEHKAGSGLMLGETARPLMTARQMILIEFETYTSLALRYLSGLENGIFARDKHDDVLASCKYLIDGAIASLVKFDEEAEFDKKAKMNLKGRFEHLMRHNSCLYVLDDLPSDAQRSIYYAHARQLSYSREEDAPKKKN